MVREAVGAGLQDRAWELAQLRRIREAAVAGEGRLVVVEGPAGIGKSALLAAVGRQARAANMTVLRARGGELERDFAFGVVRQLFEPLLAAASAELRADLLQGPAGRAAGQLDLPGAGAAPLGADAAFSALHGLYWLCANLAARGPLCIVIDDAHWADPPSLRFASFLAARIDELPVALVIAARPGEATADAAALITRMATGAVANVLRPGPLTDAGVAAVLEAELDAVPAPEFVAAAQAATGGTPFLLRELVAALRADGVVPDAAAAPGVAGLGSETVARWVLLRLGRLPEPAAQLARAVALLERCSPTQAADLAGITAAEAARAADMLATAAVLRRERPLEFVHPLVRSAVYGELPSAERAAGHRRAAELLSHEPGDEERVVEHLLEVEPAGDAWVIERLAAAAGAAERRGSPEAAATYLRRALAEPPQPADRSHMLLDCALAEDRAGHGGVRARLEAAVGAARENADRVAASMVLAHVLAREGHPADAVRALDRAAALLDPPDARLELTLENAVVATGVVHADTAQAVERRALALRALADDDDPPPPSELLATAAFVAAQHNEPADRAGALAIRALGTQDGWLPAPTDVPWLLLGALLWTERDHEAEAALITAARHATASADPGLLSRVVLLRSWLALRRGDLAGVESEAHMLLDSSVPVPLLYHGFLVAVVAEALVLRGKLTAAEQQLDDHAEPDGGRSLASVAILLARGRLRLAQHRTEEARVALLAGGALLEAMGNVGPGCLLWRADAAQVQLLLGARDDAQQLARREVALAREFGAPRALGIALRAAGVVTGGSRGEQHLHEAVGLLDGGHARLELALALTELGALLRRSNRRADSREPLRRALDIAHRAGAEQLAARAETELRATGAKPRRVSLSGVEALTPSERRVADLAAEGLTNREIAQVLYVTARTVETHLTHVFAKLDIESRSGLGKVLAGAAAGAAAPAGH